MSRSNRPGTGFSAEGVPADVTPASQRQLGQWFLAGALIILIGWICSAMATNENIEWGVVGHYVFNINILNGLLITLALAIVSGAIALVMGLAVAFCRMSENPVPRVFAVVFVWLFRSTPILVLILLCGNIALFMPRIEIGIPGTGIEFISGSTNDLIPAFVAAVIALVLHDAAYNAEIIRGGYASVDPGQHETAQALGLTWAQVQRRVVLPQALRVIVPAAANQFVTLLKATALVSTIGVTDLLTSAQFISANNLRTIELLIVATIWFLIVTSIASLGQRHLERRAGQGAGRRSKSRKESTE